MLTAEVVKDYVQTVMLPGDTPYPELERRLGPIAERGRRDVIAEGIPPQRISLHPELDMRYRGQSYELTVPLSPGFAETFHRTHQQAYGHSQSSAPVEIVNLRLRAVGAVRPPPLPRAEVGPPDPAQALEGHRSLVTGGGVAQVPFYRGERLRPGHVVTGPAVVVQKDTTIFLGRGDRARVDGGYNLVVEVGKGQGEL
jgi:N-methylhydantoinase A